MARDLEVLPTPSARTARWRRVAPWIAALLLCLPIGARLCEERAALARLAAVEQREAPAAAFPLDDAYIYQVYARNLVRGEGYAFNAGRPDSAATALLWALLLSGLHAQELIDPLVATKLLGSVLAFLACGALGVAVARWTGSALGGATASAALALTPRVAWAALAGMDPPLTLALVAGALALASGPRPGIASLVLLGLAGFSRPEAFALLPIAALAALGSRVLRLASGPREAGGGRFPLEPRCLLLGAGAMLAYATVNFLLAGDPLPSTFRAKVGPASLLDAFAGRAELAEVLARVGELPWKLWFFLWEDRGLLLVPALLGLACLLPSRELPLRAFLPLLFCAYPLAKELLAPSFNDLLFQQGRQASLLSLCGAAGLGAAAARVAAIRGIGRGAGAALGLCLTPLLSLLWILAPPVRGAAARAEFAASIQRELIDTWPWLCGALALLALGIVLPRARARAAALGVSALVLAGFARSAIQEPGRAEAHGADVLRIAHMHVGTGRWLAANTPRDARIGANDIGAIGYYSQRAIVDLFGLLDARILRFRRHASGGLGVTHAERSDLRAEFLREPGLDCDYLALFPEWYPGLLSELSVAPEGSRGIRRAPLFTAELPPNPTTGAAVKWVVALELRGAAAPGG